MNRVDPTRLAEILRTLASPQTAAAQRQGKAEKSGTVLPKTKVSRRDPQRLRERLHQRLKALKGESSAFNEQAPELTIREILCWEFGDAVLEHPEFSRVSSAVTQTMMADHQLQEQMSKLILEMIKS